MNARMNRQIEMVDVDRISMRATNPRTHSDDQIAQICRSIREFGFTAPLLVDHTYKLVAGHGRLSAALRLGMKDVPVIVLADLSEAQCQALVIADNKLALNAGWDASLLLSEIKEIDGLKEVDLKLLGFDDWELKSLFESGSVAPEPEQEPSSDPDDPRARIKVIVDRDDEADARDVITQALTAAGLTFEVK